MNKPIEIVIVGGGTAGWMSAAALVSVVKPHIGTVRLVESDDIGTVGVGEATLPQMKEFNDYIGVIEADMMRKTNASFKLGIEFVDWGFKGASYLHPFGVHGKPMGGVGFQHHWIRAQKNGRSYNIEDFSYAIAASRRNKFDFPVTDQSAINSSYSYAYHFDAGLYAKFLRGFAEAKGLRRTEGKVVDVALHAESGDIASIKLESGEVVAGDLFIDCSGFRGLLIGRDAQNGYEDWSKWLPCDTALAVPSERADPFTPYTRSTAREAGWQWRIPLQHRTGNGYVFSSAFISEDKAAATLLNNLDGRALGDPRPIRFKAGRRLKSWRRNCVAIGLSSGFLEPLESTSIYLIQIAILNLLKLFPRTPIDPVLAEEFNRLVDIEYERVRDFLILHYYANTREDSELWKYCRNMEAPDSLRQKIALFVHRGHIEKYKDGLFAPPSWLSVFLGQGVRPMDYDRLADNMDLAAMLAELDALRTRIAERVDLMPDHDAFVRDYCQAADADRAPAPMGSRA
jgi:tryptophan 7-halogenase